MSENQTPPNNPPPQSLPEGVIIVDDPRAGEVMEDPEFANEYERKRFAGRPPHEPNDVLRNKVKFHKGNGVPVEDIARLLDVSRKTLNKYYEHELEVGSAHASGIVTGVLMKNIHAGDVASVFFYLKTQRGWSEKAQVQYVGADGKPCDPPSSLQTVVVADEEKIDVTRDVIREVVKALKNEY